jgi:hypothetical protein
MCKVEGCLYPNGPCQKEMGSNSVDGVKVKIELKSRKKIKVGAVRFKVIRLNLSNPYLLCQKDQNTTSESNLLISGS